MKKIVSSIFACLLVVCSLFGLAACNKDLKLSKTTNSTEGVISNGGMTVYNDGWLYFINGTKTNNQDNNSGKNVQGAIYRAMADEKGEILYEEVEQDGKTIKKFKKVERVVSNLVGFKNGQLFIFGDFLYYTTPCKDKNKAGDMLVGKTEFRRYDLVNKTDQRLYTSAKTDDTLTYNYYKSGDELHLVVYEKNAATLTSMKIGKKVSTVFKKTEVRSAVLSENYGVSSVQGSYSDNYIYYTLSYDKNSELQRGVRVYKVRSNGEGEEKISEGESVTLLTIRAGMLIYSLDSKVYSSVISDGKDTLSFSDQDIICYKNYDNILFLDDGKSVLIADDTTMRVIAWKDGELENNLLLDLDSGDKISLIGIEGDYVYYINNKLVYKCKFKNIENEEQKRAVQLSTTEIDTPSDLIAAEVNNGYIYGMSTSSSNKLTYLYRINVLTPTERGEKDDNGVFKDVYEAEFIGVKE